MKLSESLCGHRLYSPKVPTEIGNLMYFNMVYLQLYTTLIFKEQLLLNIQPLYMNHRISQSLFYFCCFFTTDVLYFYNTY